MNIHTIITMLTLVGHVTTCLGAERQSPLFSPTKGIFESTRFYRIYARETHSPTPPALARPSSPSKPSLLQRSASNDERELSGLSITAIAHKLDQEAIAKKPKTNRPISLSH